MRLKLNELQREVRKLVKEEKNVDALAVELTRSLGPTVLTTHGLKLMAESSNNRLDYLEKTGRSVKQPKVSLLLKFADSKDYEVRKLVARLLPENFLKSMMRDRSESVRAAVARRLPAHLVVEMCERFPEDDQLVSIKNEKNLIESGLPIPEPEEDEFDIYGDIKVGSQEDNSKLSDTWYDSMAHKIILQYGGNLEGNWEELAVSRYCHSVDPMQDNIDHQKLLKMVKDKILASEKESLKESHISLRSLAQKLRSEDAIIMPVISETTDEVRNLVESNCTSAEYMKRFESVFKVKKFILENPARRLGLFEGSARILAPSIAISPNRRLDRIEENAIDKYVRFWNSQHALQGEGNILSWGPHPEETGKISFNLEIK